MHGSVSFIAARARSDVREEAILLAAMELLGEVGYENLSVEGVADRVKAGGTVRRTVVDHKRHAFAALLPERADHAWLAELTSAALLSRLLVTGEPLDDAFLAKLVDTVLLPQLKESPCGT